MPTIEELVAAANTNQHLVDFGPFKLVVNLADGSGERLRDDTKRDELADPLMRDLIARLKPQMFLDLGANFGFTSMLHHHYNPSAAIVAVEMSPLLTPFIRKTFELNGVKRATVVDAACGSAPGTVRTRLNLFGSADNRVTPVAGEKYLSADSYESAVVTVDQLLVDYPSAVPFMIKIDTQGFERHVFAGAKATLSRSSAWAIKTEFGPNWLGSQGSNAKQFLGELVEAYDVCELPQRARFRGDTVAKLLDAKLRAEDVGPFVDWLSNLNTHGKGWCDLLITPRGRTW